MKLGNVLDVDVGDAHRGKAHVGHEDEDRSPDAIGLKPYMRKQEWDQANATRHIDHAGCNGTDDVDAEFPVDFDEGLARRVRAAERYRGIRVDGPLNLRRVGIAHQRISPDRSSAWLLGASLAG